MDAHINATDPLVIDGLQYKLQPNGQYVTQRQSVSFHPSGSNVYKPVGGTRVLRIVLADGSGGWGNIGETTTTYRTLGFF